MPLSPAPTQEPVRPAAMALLSANSDPVSVGPPRQLGYGRWLLSRMRDVRAVLADPATTVDRITPKAVAHNHAGREAEVAATMALCRIVFRLHRVPNDAERQDAITITRLLQAALPRQDMQAQLACAAGASGATIDVVSGILDPMIATWRGDALGVDASLAQGIAIRALQVFEEFDGNSIRWLGPVEPLSASVLRDLENLRATHPETRDMPVLHWLSPAFLAIWPLIYTATAMIAQLAETPGLQEDLRSSADLRPGYLREVERLFGAFRYPVRQIGPLGLDLGDTRLPPRSYVVLDLAAANRDPEVWDDPETCRPDRPQRPTVSFLTGPLACTGGQLSRRFLALLLDALLGSVRVGLPAPAGGPDRLSALWCVQRGYALCRLQMTPLHG
jgi:hypothetical protein